jgi:hypothetical protein
VLVRRMSPVVVATSSAFFLIGVMFGCMPLIPVFRPLPRWIRVALHTAGGAFFTVAVLAMALDAVGSRISYSLHRLIFFHLLVISGMGVGILFLLIISGEYMKALRNLPASQQKRYERDRGHV